MTRTRRAGCANGNRERQFPLGDGALGFDFDEEGIVGIYKVSLTIDCCADHAGFFDAGVIGIVNKINGGAAFGDAAGHAKAGPGDAALDGGAGFFFGEITDVVVGVGQIDQTVHRADGVKR